MNQSQINSAAEKIYSDLSNAAQTVKKEYKQIIFEAQKSLYKAMEMADMVTPSEKPKMPVAKEGSLFHQEIALRNMARSVETISEIVDAIDVTESAENEEIVDELRNTNALLAKYVDTETAVVKAKKEAAEKALELKNAPKKVVETKPEITGEAAAEGAGDPATIDPSATPVALEGNEPPII